MRKLRHVLGSARWPSVAALILCTIGAGAQPAAHADAPLPPEREYGSIRYTTGGVTQDEAAAFRREQRNYPLAVEVLEQEPGSRRVQYTADALVRVASPEGRTVFEARANGPFMLVRLAPGRYTVSATLGARTLEKKVDVGAGQATGAGKASFVFPATAE